MVMNAAIKQRERTISQQRLAMKQIDEEKLVTLSTQREDTADLERDDNHYRDF